MRIALIGCGKLKAPSACAAKDLYTGPLFRTARTYAEKNCDGWLILSAKYGLLEPDRIIEPYELKLTDLRMNARETWRSLAVLTAEILSQHEWWAVRNPVGQEDAWKEMRALPILCFLAHEPEGIYTTGGKLPDHFIECRPVDSEGMPIPWSRVGL